MTPPKDLVLSIRGDSTPYHDDPPNAGEFYQAIGTLIVAWGRFEGHLVADMLMIRRLAGAPELPDGFPGSFKRRAKYWRTAFRTMESLAPMKDQALAFMDDAGKNIRGRNFAAHTMWREFARTEVPTMGVLDMEPLSEGMKWHIHLGVIGDSLKLGLVTAGGALLLGYPAAFALARARGGAQVVLFALVFLPLTVSIIVKSFGWGIVLRRDGILNWLLLNLGLVERPVRMIFTEASLYAGMVNVFLPFMVLPIFSVVRMMDPRLGDAAATLGASPWFRFLRVTLPLSLPGVVAGFSLVFSLAVSAYVTPSLLMGDRYMTMSMVMVKAFLNLRDWQLGAAMAAVLLAVAASVVVGASVAQRRLARQGRG